MRQQRWQDWVMLAFAVWLFFSPFFLHYTSASNVAAWNSYILGAAVAVFSIWALAYPQKWEEGGYTERGALRYAGTVGV